MRRGSHSAVTGGGRLLVLLLACGILLATVTPALAKSSIGLSAGTYRFATPRGRTLKGDIYVSNEGDTPVQVLVYSADVVTDKKGTTQFVLPKRGVRPSSDSPASWTTINAPDSTRIINNAPYLKLDVGKRSHVFFTVDVPSAAPAGDYTSIVFFEMFNVAKTKGTASRIGGRLGCRIGIRVQGMIREAVSIRPYSIGSVVFGNELPYEFTILNSGNIDHNFDSRITLLTLNEEQRVSRLIKGNDYIYARGKRNYSGAVPTSGLGLGKYVAELKVSYVKETMAKDGQITKSDEDIVKQRQFFMLPWSLTIPLAVLVVILVSAAGAVFARRRRNRPAPVPPAQQPEPGSPEAGPRGGGGWQIPPAPEGGGAFGFGPMQPEPAGEAGFGPPMEMTDYSMSGEDEPSLERPGEQSSQAEMSFEERPAEEEQEPHREEQEEDPILFGSPQGEHAAEGAEPETPAESGWAEEPGQEAKPAEDTAAEEAGAEAEPAEDTAAEEPRQDAEPDWKKSWGKVAYYGPKREKESEKE